VHWPGAETLYRREVMPDTAGEAAATSRCRKGEGTLRRHLLTIAAMVTALSAGRALAHHSFAVFFDDQKTMSVTGVVKEFQFSNPHGVLTFVADVNGHEEVWRAETNAPVILRRLGWSPDILKPGDKVTVEGWAARDGTNYLRMKRVLRPDGSQVGRPLDVPGGQK